MPKPCTFEAPLADALEDSKYVREIFRERKSLLGWKGDDRRGLPSLGALGLNTRVMCLFAEVYCTQKTDSVRAPPIAWIRKEVHGVFKKG